MTDMEILESVINDIGRICVPVDYAEQIAAPLVNISNRLKMLHDELINRSMQQPQEAPAEEEETEIPEPVVPEDSEEEFV